MYCTALRQASTAQSNASASIEPTSTRIGAPPLRPKLACRMSACSVLVGRPVEGPPRRTLPVTSGSSVATASPIASVLSARPVPEVAMIPRQPAQEEQSAPQIAAVSRSAQKVIAPSSLLPACDEAHRRRLVAHDIAVCARGERHAGSDLTAALKEPVDVAGVVASLHRELVGLRELGPLGELLLEPA